MATLDLYAPDFPHGSPQGYNDGCRSNPVCQNYGSEIWLTCKEAALARTTVHGLNRKSIDDPILKREAGLVDAPVQLTPPPRAKRETPNPPAAVVPRPSAPKPAPAPVVIDEPAAPAVDDVHEGMTDKQKRSHYNAGCRDVGCKDAVMARQRELREEKKRLAAAELAVPTSAEPAPDAIATEIQPGATVPEIETVEEVADTAALAEPADADQGVEPVVVDWPKIKETLAEKGEVTLPVPVTRLTADGADVHHIASMTLRTATRAVTVNPAAEDTAVQLEQALAELVEVKKVAQQTSDENDAFGEALLDLQRTLDATKEDLEATRQELTESDAFLALARTNYAQVWNQLEELRTQVLVDSQLKRLDTALPDASPATVATVADTTAGTTTVTISVTIGSK